MSAKIGNFLQKSVISCKCLQKSAISCKIVNFACKDVFEKSTIVFTLTTHHNSDDEEEAGERGVRVPASGVREGLQLAE